MKKNTLIIVLVQLIFANAFCQRSFIELTFTAIDSAAYIQLDSVKIMNQTQGGDTVLYWPDTVLVLSIVDIQENYDMAGGFNVVQNYPNPAGYYTTISIDIPEKDKVSLNVTDVLGRQLISAERLLDRGHHSFRLTAEDQELYFFTATWKGIIRSIKILHSGTGSGRNYSLEYQGSEAIPEPLKTMAFVQDFRYSPGDELLYIGYANGLQSGMLDAPETNMVYTFQFAINIPCPGIPTVEYEGQIYNTIQIFSQCWLKENLNVGTIINGFIYQTNNDTIEKYCYDNDPANCATYGGLYQWNEAMQYVTTQGAQGICPAGWHIPTDEEWKVLEGTVDSQYPIGDPEWDENGYRGYNAGGNLKETGITHWISPNTGSTNESGFTGLPGGYRVNNGVFFNLGGLGDFWSSSQGSAYNAWNRSLSCYEAHVNRGNSYKDYGYSVRCLKDI
jgi:uncharacterized protein (TIGR02145 family)